MWQAPIARLVALSVGQARWMLLALLGLSIAAGWLAVAKLGIETDTRALIAKDLPWRKLQEQLDRSFPQLADLIVAVVSGPTPEAADAAAAALAARLDDDHLHFQSVSRPDALPFFRANALLFLPADELDALSGKLVEAQPFLGLLATDPSLRGLARALQLVLEAGGSGAADVAPLLPVFRAIAASLAAQQAGREEPPPWRDFLTGRPPEAMQLRRLILIRPVLNYMALEPGAQATAAIHAAVAGLDLDPAQGITVGLTGPVPLADDEFASLREGAGLSTGLTVAGVLLVLLAGLRSIRLTLAILVTLFAGLAATGGFAVLAVGSLNLISVAFAALFVGIAVDFGIQFAVRFTEELRRAPAPAALRATGRAIGASLSLAALATAIGFLCFVPTDYTGVAELGLIAGGGMVIALIYNLTLLPALIRLLRPHPRAHASRQPWAAPADAFLIRHRRALRWAFLAFGLGMAAVALRVEFNADPLALKDPNSESMRTLMQLMGDPAADPLTATILAPSIPAAAQLTATLEKLPEVRSVLSVNSFVPEDQERKLATLDDLRLLYAPILEPVAAVPPTEPAQTRAALIALAAKLRDRSVLPAPLAGELADALAWLAGAGPAVQERARVVLVAPLAALLDELKGTISGSSGPVTLEQLPTALTTDWVTRKGQARVVISAAGDNRRPEVLEHFVDVLRDLDPQVTGDAVTIVEAGRTVAAAFERALILAAVAGTLLLYAVLRRVRDVVLVMAPLLLAMAMTTGLGVLAGKNLNFANIIALPLMVGIGVAFNVYFVVNWRRGETGPLQSSLARAVVFSACTTISAFGSLAISPHHGTQSMGQMLVVSLLCTLATTLLVLPALLGPPPRAKLPAPSEPALVG